MMSEAKRTWKISVIGTEIKERVTSLLSENSAAFVISHLLGVKLFWIASREFNRCRYA